MAESIGDDVMEESLAALSAAGYLIALSKERGRPNALALAEKREKLAKQSIRTLIATATRDTAKAYGGCEKCYGKGYATVSDRWSGHDTDTDIGSPGGHISGGEDFAMKFCTCDRGKQLERLTSRATRKAYERGQTEILEGVRTRAEAEYNERGKPVGAFNGFVKVELDATIARLKSERQ